MTAITKVFKSGNSQAIRIPKEFRLDAKEVEIKKVDEGLLITPKKRNWDQFLKALEELKEEDIEGFLDDIEDLPPEPKDIF